MEPIIPIEQTMGEILKRMNAFTMEQIQERNEVAVRNYRQRVGQYDIMQPNSTRLYGARPQVPVLLIPVLSDGYVVPLEDPSGVRVCDEVTIPAEPPKPPEGIVAIGDLFPGDPQKRRACLWNDTAPAGTKVTKDGVEYVKVEIPNPFSGGKGVHWYQPVV